MHARCGIRPPCLLQLSDWTCWEEDSPNHLSDLSYVQAIYWIYIYTEPIKLPTLYDHRRDSFASVTRYSIPATISASEIYQDVPQIGHVSKQTRIKLIEYCTVVLTMAVRWARTMKQNENDDENYTGRHERWHCLQT